MASLRITAQCLGRRSALQLPSSHWAPELRPQRTNTFSYAGTRRSSISFRHAAGNKDQSSKSRPTNGTESTRSPPELPALSLDSLGVSPRMKMFLICLLCIFGTIETITWTIFLYNRFYKKDGDHDESSEDS